jgi:hypothetical protein
MVFDAIFRDPEFIVQRVRSQFTLNGDGSTKQFNPIRRSVGIFQDSDHRPAADPSCGIIKRNLEIPSMTRRAPRTEMFCSNLPVVSNGRSATRWGSDFYADRRSRKETLDDFPQSPT